LPRLAPPRPESAGFMWMLHRGLMASAPSHFPTFDIWWSTRRQKPWLRITTPGTRTRPLPSLGRRERRGHVGGTFAFAGGLVGTGAIYPQCNAFVYDDVTGNSFDMPNLGVTSGTGNPTGNRWGDYLRARMGGLNPFQWTGTCYAMEGGTPRPRIVRFGRERDTYMHDRFDWDDDGAYDIGVYRGGMWYIKDQTSFAYGAPGDILVPGDYNGDGRTEAAVYRSGMWYIKDGISVGYGGIPGDVPRAGRLQQGRQDRYRHLPRRHVYIKDYISLAYGAPGDVPVPADYDGDGRTDIAVYRDGMWYVKDVTAVPYGGVPGDLPVPADYDGDDAVDIESTATACGISRISSLLPLAVCRVISRCREISTTTAPPTSQSFAPAPGTSIPSLAHLWDRRGLSSRNTDTDADGDPY